MQTELFMYFLYLEFVSGPRVKFVQWKAFKPPVMYTTDRSKVVVPMLNLFCVTLWFTLRGLAMLFVYVFLQSF